LRRPRDCYSSNSERTSDSPRFRGVARTPSSASGSRSDQRRLVARGHPGWSPVPVSPLVAPPPGRRRRRPGHPGRRRTTEPMVHLCRWFSPVCYSEAAIRGVARTPSSASGSRSDQRRLVSRGHPGWSPVPVSPLVAPPPGRRRRRPGHPGTYQGPPWRTVSWIGLPRGLVRDRGPDTDPGMTWVLLGGTLVVE
jgi:hypothetical protein